MNRLYFTNNICESIHSKIANHISNNSVTKKNCKDTIIYILNHYALKYNECKRKDYITRTLIIIIEKYKLNEKPIFISYDIFEKELKYTISFMTGNIEINSVNEIINSIIYLEKDENKNEDNNYKNIITSENDSENENIDNEDYLDDVLIKKKRIY